MSRPSKLQYATCLSASFQLLRCLLLLDSGLSVTQDDEKPCPASGVDSTCSISLEQVEELESSGQDLSFSLLQKMLTKKADDAVKHLDSSAESNVDTAEGQQSGSCARYGCSDAFKAAQSCQCTPSCDQYHNCCSDYGDRCPWVTPCSDKETCLGTVDDFLDKLPRQQNGLLQTYGDNAKTGRGGECELCDLPPFCPGYDFLKHCRYDAYDNAMAAIYYTKRGKFVKAQLILDAFIELLYPGKEVMFNGKKVSYGAADGLPSKRWLTLLAASYAPERAEAGTYWGDTVTDAAVDVGNNAWAAMAFAHYAADSGKSCYAVVAHDIMAAIKAAHAPCEDFLQGFAARLPPFSKNYRSTEHNIDMYALAAMLEDETSRKRAGTFVNQMYGFSPESGETEVYSTGTDMQERCDTRRVNHRIPVDAQTWNLLANADDIPERKHRSLAFVLHPSVELDGFYELDKDLIGNAQGRGKGDKYAGFRFSTRGSGAQMENSASAVMSMIHYKVKFGEMLDGRNLSHDIYSVGRSLRGMLFRYGSILASIKGGNSAAWQKHPGNGAKDVEYPGGSDTGFGWTYLRYPHLAATAWTGLFLLQQADLSQPVNEHANPYAPPAKAVPDAATAAAAATQCLDRGSGPQPAPAPIVVPAPNPAPRGSSYSCAELGCSKPYSASLSCQCNSHCKQYGNCCSGYDATCSGGASSDSCWLSMKL